MVRTKKLGQEVELCDKKGGNDKLVGSAVGEADNDGRRTPLGQSTLLKTENETNDDTSGQ